MNDVRFIPSLKRASLRVLVLVVNHVFAKFAKNIFREKKVLLVNAIPQIVIAC